MLHGMARCIAQERELDSFQSDNLTTTSRTPRCRWSTDQWISSVLKPQESHGPTLAVVLVCENLVVEVRLVKRGTTRYLQQRGPATLLRVENCCRPPQFNSHCWALQHFTIQISRQGTGGYLALHRSSVIRNKLQSSIGKR